MLHRGFFQTFSSDALPTIQTLWEFQINSKGIESVPSSWSDVFYKKFAFPLAQVNAPPSGLTEQQWRERLSPYKGGRRRRWSSPKHQRVEPLPPLSLSPFERKSRSLISQNDSPSVDLWPLAIWFVWKWVSSAGDGLRMGSGCPTSPGSRQLHTNSSTTCPSRSVRTSELSAFAPVTRILATSEHEPECSVAGWGSLRENIKNNCRSLR